MTLYTAGRVNYIFYPFYNIDEWSVKAIPFCHSLTLDRSIPLCLVVCFSMLMEQDSNAMK